MRATRVRNVSSNVTSEIYDAAPTDTLGLYISYVIHRPISAFDCLFSEIFDRCSLLVAASKAFFIDCRLLLVEESTGGAIWFHVAAATCHIATRRQPGFVLGIGDVIGFSRHEEERDKSV